MVVNGLPSSQARASEGERLLSWAFSNFELVKLLSFNETLQTAPTWLGVRPTVVLSAGSDLTVTVPHGWQNRIKVALDYQSPIPTPVAAGQTVGQVTVTGASLGDLQIPLIAGESVARKSLPGRAVAVLEHFVGGQ